MTETEEDEDRVRIENSKSTSRVSLFVQWLFLSTVIAVGFGVLGGMLPSRVKLLGIFAVVQSSLLVFVVLTLHRSFGLKPRRSIFVVVGILIVVQTATSFWVAFRDYSSNIAQKQKEISQKQKEDPNAALFARIDRSEFGDEEAGKEFRNERKAKLQFPTYFEHRVSQLGDWSSPWPELFAGLEILLAVGVGLLSFRLINRKTVSDSES